MVSIKLFSKWNKPLDDKIGLVIYCNYLSKTELDNIKA